MANPTGASGCPLPFIDSKPFSDSGGYTEGRICHSITDDLTCCLPCPIADWVYPDNFNTVTVAADWVAIISAICCILLLASWAALPVEKTNRHYLSVCFTFGILLMNLGLVVPLAAQQPEKCFDKITPHGMHSSKVCGASGALLLLGGWCGVMWSFLRSLSLHLQICWQVLVGRNFMIFAQAAGWGIPIIGLTLALVFSGVSFRFGSTCHINHKNSLADLWIPLLIFAAFTVILTFATFGYCVKVYLDALADSSASSEGSTLPAYTISAGIMSPRQAYRRVSRVIALQWRGLAIVLIIIADVILFSVVFVFQSHLVDSVTQDPEVAQDWILCLIGAAGNKHQCLDEARPFIVSEATISAVLLLLALNGIWLLFLLGRWTMFTGWVDLIRSLPKRRKKEFVSVDARYDVKKVPRSYELLSRESSAGIKPLAPVRSPPPGYSGQTARYHAPERSYSSPRAPQRKASDGPHETLAHPNGYEDVNPLDMNRIGRADGQGESV